MDVKKVLLYKKLYEEIFIWINLLSLRLRDQNVEA